MISYQSTRSRITSSSLDAVIKGIAPDGGLFVPMGITPEVFDWKKCVEMEFLDQSAYILSAMFPELEDAGQLIRDAYKGKFENDDIAPTVAASGKFITELFHGPTSAFKDVALSVLPLLMMRGKKAAGDTTDTVILTATSGDTGKAALEGFADVDGIKVIVFFPSEGVSAVQKLQMVSTSAANELVCAVKGDFDDCQTGVKNTFRILQDKSNAPEGVTFSSANSINIGRLIPQIAYYFSSYTNLIKIGQISSGDKVDFTVPTGNFGDILAGYYAKQLGLPIGRLICASNSNNVLTDFLRTGIYDRNRPLYKTVSPSMDILVSSNLERLLFHACGGDTEYVRSLMESLSESGRYEADEALMDTIRSDFSGYCASEDDISDSISELWHNHGYLCDTHTAVAWHCAKQYANDTGSTVPMVVLSTASPYKFPTAVLCAIGEDTSGDEFSQIERLNRITGVPVPGNLSGLRNAPEIHRDITSPETITEYVIGKIRDWK